jgi:hypothetical protein
MLHQARRQSYLAVYLPPTKPSITSQDQAQLQTGTKQIQQWETSPGFYRYLQDVFLDYSLPFELRDLAVIQTKNGIDKYWRKTARK